MLDVGSGPALVLIPGIQGRWEWMRPAIDVLARDCRVITASLPGEPGIDPVFGEDAGFDVFMRHIDGVLDAAGLSRAVICGVSFGGLIALRYAATRTNRVRGLILVSTPGPGWKLNRRLAQYARWPTLCSPLFAAGAVRRGWNELRRLYPGWPARLRVGAETAWRVVTAPAIPRRMSRRAVLAERQNFEADCGRVRAPTLVITGERDLDLVVPCDDTLRYLGLIPGASYAVLEATGHLGTVLAPEQFAAIVRKFLWAREAAAAAGARS